MSDHNDSAERAPGSGVPEWLKPIEYNEGLEDDNEGPPDDAPDQRLASIQTQPSNKHPRSGKPTSNYITYIDLMQNPARFDLDRLKTWPLSGGDCWYGRGQQGDEILYRVPPAQGETIRWVLVYPALEEHEAAEFTIEELNSFTFGRNYLEAPVSRELTPQEAAEWLERNGYELPDGLDPAPPFDASKPLVPGRLHRDWRPVQAPDGGPPEPAKKEWRSRVFLRGRSGCPSVGGVEKDTLTEAQYDVIKALLDAGESGLNKNRLIKNSGHTGAVNVLRRLSEKDPAWRSVIRLAGKKGCAYRLT
jgi:hypothetical protein